MGEAKRRKAEIERLKNQEAIWRESLTPEQRTAADVAVRAYDRIVKPLQLREACYQMAMFLNQYLRDKYSIHSEVVIGWVSDGTWPGVASHAWIEVGGKKIDVSLTHTSDPIAVPTGGLLILDRLLTKGDATYTYYREPPQSAAEYLERMQRENPATVMLSRQKDDEHQRMKAIAGDVAVMRQYLDVAPVPTRFETLVRRMGDDLPIPSEQYKVQIAALDREIQRSTFVSRACAGFRAPTSSHFYASILFTTLCTRAVSVAILAPFSHWSNKRVEHWDYASMAALTRPILELRIAFFYLCIEACSEDEWACRLNIFHAHDCNSRIRLFSEMENTSQDTSGFRLQLQELQGRLTSSVFFNTIPANEQKQYLNGNKPFLSPLEDIGVRAGIDLNTFRWLYKFSSTHVHGLPMSYYRMGEQERGRGVHSDTEEGYTTAFLDFVTVVLERSREEMMEKFKEQADFSKMPR